jgi:ribosomal protein S18 acetylase RimI-like enzyme
MVSEAMVLPGQETLVASWEALAELSSGARLIRSPATVAAVFPSWLPLNNAIAVAARDSTEAALAAAPLRSIYADAGVGTWALWIPSRATDLDAPDTLRDLAGFTRDTTTLVMQATVRPGLRRHPGVVRASVAAATRAAGDEPVPLAQLGEPDDALGLAAWAMVHDGMAVAGAWSLLHDGDCGIYTVGTLPEWRRRGLAGALTEHILADAHRHGARTATLQSTPMAQRLYESLGFAPVGRYEEWIADHR